MQEFDAKEEKSPNSEMALDETLDVEEERIVKLWNMTKVLKVSGVSSGDNSHLRRSDKQALEAMRSVMIVFNHSPSCFYAIRFILLEVMSSAWAFFQRFCLSHSVLEFNPEIMAFSALFLASKIEDEILPIQDLVEAISGDGEEATTKREISILAMEGPLLEGIRFNLRVFSPYHPLLAFLGDLHQYGKKKENKLLVKALPRIEACSRAVVDALLCTTHLSFLYAPAALGLSAMLYATSSLANAPLETRNNGQGRGDDKLQDGGGFDFDCTTFLDVQGYTETIKMEVKGLLEKIGSDPELKSAYKYPERKTAIRAIMKRYKKVIPKLEEKLKRCAIWDDSTIPNADGGGSSNVGEDSRGGGGGGIALTAHLPTKRPRLESLEYSKG